MQNDAVLTQPKKRRGLPPAAKWALALLAALGAAAALVYYWRVFYSYGQYPFAHIPAGVLTALLCGIAALSVGLAWALPRFVHSFSLRAAAAIFCVGLLFVFIDPPFQVPDEAQHYLRAYSISQGHFDFDATRTYPADVQALNKVFRIAWTSAHDGAAVKGRTDGRLENPTPADVVRGECISNHYVDYANLLAGEEKTVAYYGDPAKGSVTEPAQFTILPLLPQAAGIGLARLLGFTALGQLYGGRMANLLFYAFLCWAALKNCRRYRPVFLAVMLLPLSLFLAGSCSYDAMMLGLYFFAASYFCKDEITNRDIWLFAGCIALMCSSGKYNNLLWAVLPFVLPRRAWKTTFRKWQAAVVVLAAAVLLYGGMTLYNTIAITRNFDVFDASGEVVRTTAGADTKAQALFMLQNPLRTLAVFWGTLFENDFFVLQLGVLGNMDLSIPVLNGGSALVLLLGSALSVHQKSSLTPRSCFGLLGLAALYTGSVLAGLYVSYTPVGMVRVIGLQPRYFLPAFLMLFILLAALLSHVLAPSDSGRGTARAVELGLGVSVLFGLAGALLLFQYYFVGPVAIVPLA